MLGGVAAKIPTPTDVKRFLAKVCLCVCVCFFYLLCSVRLSFRLVFFALVRIYCPAMLCCALLHSLRCDCSALLWCALLFFFVLPSSFILLCRWLFTHAPRWSSKGGALGQRAAGGTGATAQL